MAAGSPIMRRPILQITSAVTAERAIGTSRRVSHSLPATQNTGTVSRTSCEPPYACPQKNVVRSPPAACLTMSPTTASSLSGIPSADRCTQTRSATPAAAASATTIHQRDASRRTSRAFASRTAGSAFGPGAAPESRSAPAPRVRDRFSCRHATPSARELVDVRVAERTLSRRSLRIAGNRASRVTFYTSTLTACPTGAKVLRVPATIDEVMDEYIRRYSERDVEGVTEYCLAPFHAIQGRCSDPSA